MRSRTAGPRGHEASPAETVRPEPPEPEGQPDPRARPDRRAKAPRSRPRRHTPGCSAFRSAAALAHIPLAATGGFAGCFEKQVGVEYEDCYFKVEGLHPELLQWLDGTLNGSNPERDFSVVQMNPASSTQSIASVNVQDAFLSEIRIGDYDGNSRDPGSISFVAVPESVDRVVTGGFSNADTLTRFGSANYRLELEEASITGVVALKGLVMTAEKIPDALGGRVVYSQGPFTFNDFTVEFTNTTAFDQWADIVSHRTD